MKDVLISSTMSMSDDFFASESLTTECVLSVEIMSRSFNQRDSRLICMYCSLEIVITRHKEYRRERVQAFL